MPEQGLLEGDGDRLQVHRQLQTPDGIQTAVLKQGADGKASKGDFLQMPALELLASPITVQLMAADGIACWEAVYSAPFQVQSELQLKAKAQ